MSSDNKQQEHSLALSVTTLFGLALFVLALFQSNALVSLTYDFPPSFLTERLVVMAEGWHGWMQALGTAGITESIAEIIEMAHSRTVSD